MFHYVHSVGNQIVVKTSWFSCRKLGEIGGFVEWARVPPWPLYHDGVDRHCCSCGQKLLLFNSFSSFPLVNLHQVHDGKSSQKESSCNPVKIDPSLCKLCDLTRCFCIWEGRWLKSEPTNKSRKNSHISTLWYKRQLCAMWKLQFNTKCQKKNARASPVLGYCGNTAEQHGGLYGWWGAISVSWKHNDWSYLYLVIC